MRTKEYKQLKGLKKENLRDNMTNIELALNILAEVSTSEISKQKNPSGFKQNVTIAKEGGSVAKVARKQLEEKLGTHGHIIIKGDGFLTASNRGD